MSTNSDMAARISLPPVSTTCASLSSLKTRGRHGSPPPASRVISGTITCACASKVTRSSLDRDQREHPGDHEKPADPDPGPCLLEVASHHEWGEQQRDRHAHEVRGQHDRDVRLAERKQPEPGGE